MSGWSRFAIIPVLIVIFEPAVWAQSPQQNARARSIFVEGRNFWDDGEFIEAEKKFREALARYPDAEQADRTAYYLITALIHQGRAGEALKEIETFPKRYPRSPWLSDVQEKRIALVGIPTPSRTVVPFRMFQPGFTITTQIVTGQLFVRIHELRSEIERTFSFYSSAHPFALASEASLRHEILRVLIESDLDRGISVASERLKLNPSDPAVVSNLGVIAHNNSFKALSFIAHIAESADPGAQSQAIYWLSRQNVNKEELAKVVGDLLSDGQKNGPSIAGTTLARLPAPDQRKILDRLLQSPRGVEQLGLLYHHTNAAPLRVQIVSAMSQLPGSAPLSLISTAARDPDARVSRTAIETLSERQEPEARRLLQSLRSSRNR